MIRKNFHSNGSNFRQLTLLSALLLACVLPGCDREIKGSQNVLSQSASDFHPDGWMSSASENFHGKEALLMIGDNCVDCHGTDYNGGISEISCVSCHSQRKSPCITCHGGLDLVFGNPPYGLEGEISDTTVAVGAHTAHVLGSQTVAKMDCQVCHIKPDFVLDSAHLDISFVTRTGYIDSIAEVTWGGFAVAPGATWDRNQRTCSGTYCHGNFEGGNRDNAPIWTSGKGVECGSCHDTGTSPEKLSWKHELHVSGLGLACNSCHTQVVSNTNSIINKQLHVNGKVEVVNSNEEECKLCHEPGADYCVRCHGGVDNQTGAPPKGLHGETSTFELAVGAHSTHVQGGDFADAFDCNECHIKPLTVADPGHYDKDSVAEISWSSLAGSSSRWNRTNATCSETYCHGNFSGGNTANSPIWTGLNQSDCGSCHDDGSNPGQLSGRHRKHVSEERIDCIDCHYSTVDAQRDIIGKDIHVDGLVQVVLKDGGTYSNGTCNPSCHGSENWSGGD